MTQITLYAVVPFDRGARARWLAYELGVELQDHKVDIANKEHKSESYKKINPFGQVPAAVIDGKSVFDSAAMCMHLLELHPDSGLSPKVGSPERAAFLSWLMFGLTTLDKAVFDLFFFKRTPENAEKRKVAFERLKPLLDILSDQLKNKVYAFGEKFSFIDIILSYNLMLLRRDEVLSQFPVLDAYVDRMAARPAAEKAGLFKP